MALNIDQTKCSFYTEIIPPSIGSVSFELSVEWGSRIAEHSGRARGLYAIGTVSVAGTTIMFPTGYFSNIPIVDIMCYNNPIGALAFSSLPAADHGYFTSLNLSKVSEEYLVVGLDRFEYHPIEDSIFSWRAYGV